MKITNTDNVNSENLDKLNAELKNKISQRQNEIEKVKNLYDQKLNEQKQLGEEAYTAKIEQNNLKVISAASDIENKLKGYKDNLEKTKLELDAQDKILRQDAQNKIIDIKDQFNNSYENTHADALAKQEDVQFKTQQIVQNLNYKTSTDIDRLQNQSHTEIQELSTEFGNKAVENEKDFRDRISQDIITHQELITQQKDEFKKNINLNTEKNNRLASEKVRVQNDELTYLDQYHKDLMNQKEADFKIRYNTQANEHQRILGEITKKLDESINKAQLNAQSTMRSIATKGEDPFYRIEKIEPKFSEVVNGYKVSLKIPEHEKENVHLVAKGREIKVTLNKKFSDTVVEEDGSINRSNKSQLYSKEFKTTDLLNSKHITEKYEDGVLTFHVDKL